jgi:hypothetical protein
MTVPLFSPSFRATTICSSSSRLCLNTFARNPPISILTTKCSRIDCTSFLSVLETPTRINRLHLRRFPVGDWEDVPSRIPFGERAISSGVPLEELWINLLGGSQDGGTRSVDRSRFPGSRKTEVVYDSQDGVEPVGAKSWDARSGFTYAILETGKMVIKLHDQERHTCERTFGWDRSLDG